MIREKGWLVRRLGFFLRKKLTSLRGGWRTTKPGFSIDLTDGYAPVEMPG